MVPAAFADIESDLDDRLRFVRMSPEERLALFAQLCDLTDSIHAGRPNRAALRAPAPVSAEALALWARLMRQQHG
jgi:hypothetical protein